MGPPHGDYFLAAAVLVLQVIGVLPNVYAKNGLAFATGRSFAHNGAALVALTGQVGSNRMHKELHQYVDVVSLVRPITKWNTAVAFSMAICLIMLYPRNKVIVFSALVYAFYIGFAVSVTIHWFSEFAAGAIIGSVIGITVGRSFRTQS
jgi:hypothetical protein